MEQDKITQDLQQQIRQLSETLSKLENEEERRQISELIGQLQNITKNAQEKQSNRSQSSQSKITKNTYINNFVKKRQIKIKMEKNLQDLFLFYCKQIPNKHGLYELKTIQQSVTYHISLSLIYQSMYLNMFMVFNRQFNLLSQHIRQPVDGNELEKKKRGEIDKITPAASRVRSQDFLPMSDGIGSYKMYKNQTQQKLMQPYKDCQSRHQWWNEDKEFDRYYNPQVQKNVKDVKHEIQDYKTLMQIFKKNSIQGKYVQADYPQFKIILTVLAEYIYPHIDDPNERKLKIYTQVLFLHKTKLMKKHMKSLHHAFNILEKPGFRSLPKIEHPEQSQGNTRAKMYGVTGITGATDLHKGGNKLNMIKSDLVQKYRERQREIDLSEKIKMSKMVESGKNKRLSEQIREFKGIQRKK